MDYISATYFLLLPARFKCYSCDGLKANSPEAARREFFPPHRTEEGRRKSRKRLEECFEDSPDFKIYLSIDARRAT
jgi:hypothetical protein